ncbi:hypothetical protein D3C74_465010 [compost metagenome]
MDFDLVRLVDLVDHHRAILPLDLGRQIGVGNLGVHDYGIHIRITHHNAALAVYAGSQHQAYRPY